MAYKPKLLVTPDEIFDAEYDGDYWVGSIPFKKNEDGLYEVILLHYYNKRRNDELEIRISGGGCDRTGEVPDKDIIATLQRENEAEIPGIKVNVKTATLVNFFGIASESRPEKKHVKLAYIVRDFSGEIKKVPKDWRNPVEPELGRPFWAGVEEAAKRISRPHAEHLKKVIEELLKEDPMAMDLIYAHGTLCQKFPELNV